MSELITCPNCGCEFEIEEALTGKLRAEMEAQYQEKLQAEIEKQKAKETELKHKEQQIAQQQSELDELLNKKLQEALIQKEKEISAQVREGYEEELKQLRHQTQEQREQNLKLRKEKIQLQEKEQQLKEQEEELELKMKETLQRERDALIQKTKEQQAAQFKLKELEYQKKLEDQRKMVDEMKRKAETGSQQLQGEVQELAIESVLEQNFPFDRIEEVSKGARGADCQQFVINQQQQECGSIIFESKRTKNWSNEWLSKLKEDQVQAKADIAVIVTQAMPPDMTQMGQLEGVWVCRFHELKSVVSILRQVLLETQKVKVGQQNKGEKMELLYDYLTSNEFVQNVKRIKENYDEMHQSLLTERRAMERLWKAREKQIESVQTNLSHLFGSITGIAGKEIDTAGVLELPGTDEVE
jgi:hypothetical protein